MIFTVYSKYKRNYEMSKKFLSMNYLLNAMDFYAYLFMIFLLVL